MDALPGRTLILFMAESRSSGVFLPAMDDEVKVKAVKGLLAAGPTPQGGHREHELFQFWADQGGLRTIRTDAVIDVR